MIPLRWSHTGPSEDNAYGEVVSAEGHAWICEHGGSQWLCRSCSEAILKLPEARRSTPEERAKLRTWENQ